MSHRRWLVPCLFSFLCAGPLLGQPATIEWTDQNPYSPDVVYEFSNAQLHATDPSRAGSGYAFARVTSDLRGDEETITLLEDPAGSATFWAEIMVPATLSTDPPLSDGTLEVTEHAGPPLQRDTIRAELLSCGTPPCPTAAVPMVGSRVRIIDDQGADVDNVHWTMYVEVTDHSASPYGTTATVVSQSGDSETVSLLAIPWPGIFRGSLAVELAAPVAGNGRLEVAAADLLTASHLDPLGLAVSSDTAVVAPGTIEFLDRQGRSVGHVLADGMLSLRVTYADGNTNPGIPEVVIVTARSKGDDGGVHDTETLWLYEDAADSGVFSGGLPTRVNDFGSPGSWQLTTFYNGTNGGVHDVVEVSLVAAPVVATAPVVPAVVRIAEQAGADVDYLLAGDEIYLEVETELGSYQTQVTVRGLTGGDEETFIIYETGYDTSIFRSYNVQTYATATPYPHNGIVELLPAGEVVRAEHSSSYGSATDTAVSGDGDPNTPPPTAVDDAASTPDGTAVAVDVLANDSNAAGGPLSVTSFSQGSQGGGVTLSGNGVLTYTPLYPFFLGTETITYRVTNAVGDSAQATVTVTVYAVNEPPIAGDDYFEIDEDQGGTLTPLANDVDPENEGLGYGSISSPSKGIIDTILGPPGSLLFMVFANANGLDTFTYEVYDPLGGVDTATVTVLIRPQPDAPFAALDQATTDEDVPVLVDVLANDSDVDGEALQITAVTPVSNGVPAIQSGRVLFTPTADFNGAASFRYTISDPTGRTSTATVNVTVRAVADSPIAEPDTATTAEETAVTVDVLANDRDGDGDALSLSAVGTAEHGTVVVSSQRALYTPAADYFGGDSFTYSVSDSTGRTATGTVTVTVSNVQDAPVAAGDQATTAEDTAATIAVLGNDSDADGDSLAIVAVSQGGKGSVAIAGASVTYTPNANANGADSFTYTAGDGHGGTATATVAVTIDAANDAPDAVDDAAGTNEDTAVTIAVRANDVDVDGETVALVSVTQGTRGSVAANADGTVTYTPNANAFGADSFGYTIRDAAGLTDGATVVVAVAAVNDAPVAVNDSATTDEGSAVVIAVLANDSDVDGGPLAVTAVSSPAHGSATITGNGTTVTYTPASTYSGADSFSYAMSDGAATAGATVSIQVKDLLRNVAVLATHGAWLQTGADVLSGDLIVNAAGSAPFLNGGVELSVASSATTAAGWDVEANRITVAAGAVVAGDVYYNQLTNGGTIGGALYTPLALPVFASLPAFLNSTPGAADVNVANNGTRTLAPGSYRDLIVGRKATVTFTGGTYHFRSVRVDRESKLLFAAAGELRVQQQLSTSNLVTIGPGAGSTATAASIVIYVGGINGTGGGLAASPKAVEIGVDNVLSGNVYGPNGTVWLKDRARATGSLFGKDVQMGVDAQVSLSSAW